VPLGAIVIESLPKWGRSVCRFHEFEATIAIECHEVGEGNAIAVYLGQVGDEGAEQLRTDSPALAVWCHLHTPKHQVPRDECASDEADCTVIAPSDVDAIIVRDATMVAPLKVKLHQGGMLRTRSDGDQ
jgi:hypothetical protein